MKQESSPGPATMKAPADSATSATVRSNPTRWHVRVRPRRRELDGHGRAVLADVHQLGLTHIENICSSRIYLLEGKLTKEHVSGLAEELFTDPVAETAEYAAGFSGRNDEHPTIEVHPLPGVMDPVALSALEAARELLSARFGEGAAQITAVGTARRYEVIGARDVRELETIASRVLANDCIERWYLTGCGRNDDIPDEFPTPPVSPFTGSRHVPIRDLSDDELQRLSRTGHLFLSLDEMRVIRDHYRALHRDPTDLELETLAQTWSEHCVHKTLKSAFDYRGEDFGRPGEIEARFDNLLKDTIAATTKKLDRDWCLSVFVDNAGVIAFDNEYGIAFKVETHNHPSAIEPYGGAATGVGGCIRDVMGCGLGAKPIASTDVFCLARPDFPEETVPAGVLHPRRVLKGVVRGVRDYGNRMGIPTVNGAIYFDDRYLANPLVFCGCVGLIPRRHITKAARTGDLIVVAGGRTGRDGIHGATFSSAELTDTHADEFSHAVQIGNAIVEKKLLDALLIARDHPDGCLFSAVTDCGAGGLSSAVGEMAQEIGAAVDLENVPLKYSGLRYDEIWISEAQERMVFAVPPERIERFLQVFADEEVEATVIGAFTGDKTLRVRFRGTGVGELDMHFLHEGLPKRVLTARWKSDVPATIIRSRHESQDARGTSRPTAETSDRKKIRSLTVADRIDALSDESLVQTLGSLNVASKEWVIRQYDHEVQGRSVIKPLTGPGAGPADAAVLRPLYESGKGVAIACGLCPWLADVDPYWMAVAAVDEALRNVICVGADPAHTAVLDNFCWPRVDHEESLGALVRACRGAHDAALAYGLPFISGKDSLNNEFSMSAQEAKRTGLPPRMAIPYTLLISALGLVEDVSRCVTLDLKRAGNCIALASAPVLPIALILQSIASESLNDQNRDRQRAAVASGVSPDVDSSRDPVGAVDSHNSSGELLNRALDLHRRVSSLIREGKVRAAHDVSDGGLAVTIAEMCIASGLGADVTIDDHVFSAAPFAPIPTTYVLEMAEADAAAAGFPVIGRVTKEPRLRINAQSGSVDISVDTMAKAWREPLSLDQGA